MAYVQRANVVLEIKDESIQYYLDLGYNVIDNNGKVIVSAVPSDLGELRKFYVEGHTKIEELTAKINELEAKLSKRGRPKKSDSEEE